MRRDIKNYVASCAQYQKRKITNYRTQGFTKPLPVAEDVFDTIGIDLITPLPRTYSGYNSILVCTDNLSKFVVSVALKNTTAASIIHAFFNKVIAIHGCPKLVISDRGANISGEESRDFFCFNSLGARNIHLLLSLRDVITTLEAQVEILDQTLRITNYRRRPLMIKDTSISSENPQNHVLIVELGIGLNIVPTL